jgi:tryptophan synthase alpha chain
VSRLDSIFGAARAEGRLVASIYLMVGHPDPGASLELARGALDGGAEVLEIGVPFSDPLADGPTIQAASFEALENGVTLNDCLDLVRTLRAESDAALLLMGYVNPFLAAGWDRLARDAREAGADGFIIPDLPPEEAGAAQAAFAEYGLSLIPMLAPTSSAARLDLGTRQAAGFIYCVALTGTTGVRTEMDADLGAFLQRVRDRSDVPLVVGFGISTPAHVTRLRGIADGFIVGSAFVRLAAETDPSERAAAAAEFARGLAAAAR